MITATELLTCLGHPVQFQNQVTTGGDTVRYAIAFDAGSTKTKIEIYKTSLNAPPLDVSDIHQLDPSPSKVKPGIADLAGKLTAVEDYLKPLLTSAMKTVPREKHKSTPIIFLATGGMRLLRADQANAILKEVKELFNDKNKCSFKSGAFEGIYAGISFNFLKGNLIPGNRHSTSGILDLVGASHQNTFDYPNNRTNTNIFSLTVGGETYHLFARGYLGYSLSQARQRYLEIITWQSITKSVIKSPCHHKGFQE